MATALIVPPDLRLGVAPCFQCKKPSAGFVCNGCRVACYCNVACQTNAWKEAHHMTCSHYARYTITTSSLSMMIGWGMYLTDTDQNIEGFKKFEQWNKELFDRRSEFQRDEATLLADLQEVILDMKYYSNAVAGRNDTQRYKALGEKAGPLEFFKDIKHKLIIEDMEKERGGFVTDKRYSAQLWRLLRDDERKKYFNLKRDPRPSEKRKREDDPEESSTQPSTKKPRREITDPEERLVVLNDVPVVLPPPPAPPPPLPGLTEDEKRIKERVYKFARNFEEKWVTDIDLEKDLPPHFWEEKSKEAFMSFSWVGNKLPAYLSAAYMRLKTLLQKKPIDAWNYCIGQTALYFTNTAMDLNFNFEANTSGKTPAIREKYRKAVSCLDIIYEDKSFKLDFILAGADMDMDTSLPAKMRTVKMYPKGQFTSDALAREVQKYNNVVNVPNQTIKAQKSALLALLTAAMHVEFEKPRIHFRLDDHRNEFTRLKVLLFQNVYDISLYPHEIFMKSNNRSASFYAAPLDLMEVDNPSITNYQTAIFRNPDLAVVLTESDYDDLKETNKEVWSYWECEDPWETYD